MNKKNLAKVTGTSAAAFLIAGTTAFTAFAALPEGTVVIGNKAFSLEYANLAANVEEIRAAIIAGDGIYVKAPNGTWYNNNSQVLTDTSVIPAVAYKAADGKVTNYAAKDGDAVATGEVNVASVTPVGAKKIEVKFGAPVDTAKAVLAVKREAVKVNVSTVTWNADKTVATIELASKISKANYTVEVTGLTTTALTSTFAGVDEKVNKIQILSTDAPLVDVTTDADANVDDLSVAYRVYNQYGEDITKVTSVVATSSGTATNIDQTKGVIEITGNFDAYISNKAAVTIIHAETGVSATATLNVVSEAKVSEITIVGLYNKDGKALTESTNLATDKFYLEITAKDQYGNAIDPETNEAQLLYSESNNTVISLDAAAAGIPDVDDTVVEGRYFIQLNGVTGVGTNFAKTGESVVTIISRNTGKSASYTVKVGEGVRANTLTVSQPDIVAVNEDAYLPLSVYDKEGNEIKDLALLDDAVRGVTVSLGDIVLKSGALFIKVPAASNNAETIKTVVVTVNPTHQVTSVNYTVKALAVPKVIAGLVSTVSSQLNGTISQAIKAQDLVIEDQYGRQMTKAAINSWIDAGNSITLASTVGAATAFTVASTDTPADTATQTINSSTDTFTVAPSAADATSEKLTFTLVQGATPVSSSAKDIVFSKSGLAEYASYKIKALDSIYNSAASSLTFKVYGTKADGTDVLLDSTKYSLAYNDTIFNNAYANGTNTITLDAALAGTVIDNDSTTATPDSKSYTFTVTIGNAAATQVTKSIKVSALDQDVAEIGFSTTGKWYDTAFDGANFDANGTTLSAIELGQYAFTKDVYGVYANNVASFDSITFSNLVKTTGSTAVINVANNGTAAASVTGLVAGDRVTATVKKDGVTKTLEITVVEIQ